jgi:hypothetical protein
MEGGFRDIKVKRYTGTSATGSSGPGVPDGPRALVADGRHGKLTTDLDSEPVIDFRVTRHGSTIPVNGIHENRVTASFALETTAIALQVVEQFVALHGFAKPASTVRGINSMRSASGALTSESGTGSGLPSSR